jgi:hypothetical protein
VKAQTRLNMLIIAANSDFLTMVPRQGLDFAKPGNYYSKSTCAKN